MLSLSKGCSAMMVVAALILAHVPMLSSEKIIVSTPDIEGTSRGSLSDFLPERPIIYPMMKYTPKLNNDSTTLNCTKCLKYAQWVENKLPKVNGTYFEVDVALVAVCLEYPEDTCMHFGDEVLRRYYVKDFLLHGAGPEVVCVANWMCNANCCLSDGGPEQLHLSLTGKLNELSVMWTTTEGVVDPVVTWETPSQGANSAPARNWTFTSEGWIGMLYQATMSNLLPGTTYTYRVGSKSTPGGLSSNTTFIAPNPNRQVADGEPNQRVILVADMGVDECSDSTVSGMMTVIQAGLNRSATTKRMLASTRRTGPGMVAAEQLDAFPVDFVFHVGDLAYAESNNFIYDLFLRKTAPIASSTPYMTAVGNHENFDNFTSYLNRFDMPWWSSNGTNNFWYSFDYGLAHYTVFSTEHNLTVGSAQYEWLKNDLTMAAATRSPSRPWMFLLGHKMLYCTTIGSDCEGLCNGIRANVEPLTRQFGVDVVFSGHVHAYERMYPVFMNHTDTSYANPNATVYLVNGCGGAHSDPPGVPSCDMDYGWLNPSPEWSAVRISGQIGFSVLDITPDVLTYSFLRGNDTAILDQVVVSKNETETSWLRSVTHAARSSSKFN
eukprot:TRINITY_DN2272_c0_g1_i1.p1 TRINITY_DN2272_c0_g1~~TRINITY_DN2272_c0_g1_i1.p1  ORF type:complete len:606 (+),score=90.15 TRINITY_DN2272_c0_g1_i1:140-1957(+)